nr:chemotaxis response regulator protein-glutamate methylesterase [Paracoccus saliphilus]
MSRPPYPDRAVRVLIVDDSAVIRKVLTIGLSTDPQIHVVGAAASAEQAREMIGTLNPDVMTLDIEMPRLDGVSFLRELMPTHPLPTVIISSTTQRGAAVTLAALEAGAVDVIAKPSIGVGEGLPAIMAEVCQRVRAAAQARPTTPIPDRSRPTAPCPATGGSRMIAIGASTGGVQALAQILQSFPKDAPGIVIVQHMPEGFTSAFARRLNDACAITVREARDGDAVTSGLALLAPGGKSHLTVNGRGPNWYVSLAEGEPVCFSRPSVDVMFRSVARAVGGSVVAALLTGMGKDGAQGLLAIRKAGGVTIAQDEATSVVWGMPAAAVELGAASAVLPLEAISEALLAATRPANRGISRHIPHQGVVR